VDSLRNLQAEEGANSIKLPTFLVIGAMRAGTTTLYYDLRSHPDVYMAPIKETNFFAIHDEKIDLPLTDESATNLISSSVGDPREYRQLFEGAAFARAVGEVSPSYLYSPSAAGRIKASLPAAQIVALLRDPVDRAYSAYLRRADAMPDPEAFLRVAETEQQDLEFGRSHTHYPLILGGLYSLHLSPYIRSFPRSRLWLGLFDDFWSSPERSYAELHDFLGIEPKAPLGDSRFNRSGVPRSARVDRIIRSGARTKAYAKRYLPPKVVRSLANMKQKVEDWSLDVPDRLPAEIRAYLIERYFGSEIGRLETMIDRDLAAWLAV
jgi:hypothetical protein